MITDAFRRQFSQYKLNKEAGRLPTALIYLDGAISEAKLAQLHSLVAALYSQKAKVHQADHSFSAAVRDLVSASEWYVTSDHPKAALDAIEKAWSLSQSAKLSESGDLRRLVFRRRASWQRIKCALLLRRFRLRNLKELFFSLGEYGWALFMPLIANGRSLFWLGIWWALFVTLGAIGIFIYQKHDGSYAHQWFVATYTSIVTFFGYGFFEMNVFPKELGIVTLTEAILGVPFMALLTATIIGKVIDE